MNDIDKLGRINRELQSQKVKWESDIAQWTEIYNRTGSSSAWASLDVAKSALASLASISSILTKGS